MGKKRRVYTREFKHDALRLIAEGRSVADVARGLGIQVNTLHGWRERLAADPRGNNRGILSVGSEAKYSASTVSLHPKFRVGRSKTAFYNDFTEIAHQSRELHETHNMTIGHEHQHDNVISTRYLCLFDPRRLCTQSFTQLFLTGERWE